MEIVNYRMTTTQPDGSERVDLWAERGTAEDFAETMTPWPVKVEEQRFAVEVGTVITVRSFGNSREYTGKVESIRAESSGSPQMYLTTGTADRWFYPWQVLRVEDAAETREHDWLPPVEGIRTCRRLNCYAQWMPGKSERLGCKGTSSE